MDSVITPPENKSLITKEQIYAQVPKSIFINSIIFADDRDFVYIPVSKIETKDLGNHKYKHIVTIMNNEDKKESVITEPDDEYDEKKLRRMVWQPENSYAIMYGMKKDDGSYETKLVTEWSRKHVKVSSNILYDIMVDDYIKYKKISSLEQVSKLVMAFQRYQQDQDIQKRQGDTLNMIKNLASQDGRKPWNTL